MGWTTYDFDDLVVDLGTRDAPLPVAVVSGTCDITYDAVHGDDFGHAYEWDLGHISLDSGHFNGGRFRLDQRSDLYKRIAGALSKQRGDQIYREIEVTEGDALPGRFAA